MSLHGRDRLFLKAWGLGLADLDFARCLAVAGMGSAAPAGDEGRGGGPDPYRLEWAWPGVAGVLSRGRSESPSEAWQAAVLRALPAPERLLERWHALVREHRRLAFRIVRQSIPRGHKVAYAALPWAQVAILAQWLLLPDEVAGVHIRGGPGWADASTSSSIAALWFRIICVSMRALPSAAVPWRISSRVSRRE